jgi:type I restriction enzyme M protein
MPDPFPITRSVSGTAAKAPTAQWRFSLAELRNRLAHGQVWGMAQSLGELLDLLAFLCILRVEEREETERRAIDEFNGTERAPEFPEQARWEMLESIEPDQFAWHIQEGLFPAFREMPPESPLRLLPRLFDPARFGPAAYQAAVEILSSPLLPFERYLELERSEKALGLEDKAAELFSGWKGVGEFITPARVADLMIDLAAPKAGERIYNPCSGFGTLLVRTAKRIILPALRQGSPTLAHMVKTSTFCGIELNPRICLVALARLMLAGITRPRLELGDVLERPMPEAGQNGGFDCILCNPPIGSSALPDQTARFPIRSRSTETLILQHILAHLRPGGRAVVLMPEAFLYRQGGEELLRKRLVQDYRLEAVVALPPGGIHGLGEIRTSLLVVHRMEPAKSIAFVQAAATQDILWGYKEAGGKNALLAGLVGLIKARGAPEGGEAGVLREEPPPVGDLAKLQSRVNWETTEVLSGRRWELVPKFTGVDQLQVLLDAIQRTDKQTEIRTLRYASCSVWSGMSYRRSDMLDEKAEKPAEGTEEVRLVRVRDISKLGPSADLKLVASPSMARMTKEGVARAARHCFLREGDILLTVTGTIGKVAVVGGGGSWMVAASGVDIIRVSDAALASYLPRLLTTEPYQTWMKRRSLAGYVNRLSIKDVEHLAVPVFTGGVPPDAIRQVTAGQSLESITRVLEAKPGFSASVRFLLEDDLVRLLVEPTGVEPAGKTPREMLKDLVARVSEIRREGTVDDGIEPLFDWLAGFHDFAARLLDILELPVGPERFSSLQAWWLQTHQGENPFRRAYEELGERAKKARYGEGGTHIRTICSRMEGLYDALLSVWRADHESHLGATRISASLSPALVTLGMPTDVSISVMNEGPLPLRKVTFETRPYDSQSGCILLKPGGSHHWPVKIVGKESGKQPLFLVWKGRRMDESEASGEIELAFEVVSLRVAATAAGELGENPYIYRRLPEGKHERMFYGREAELRRIVENLDRPSATTILLVEGNRGIGKTWLLKHLISRRLPAAWVPVFIDFQDFEGESGSTARAGIPTRHIFIGMARELITAARNALPELELPVVGVVPPVSALVFRTFLDSETPRLISAEQPWTTFKTLFHVVRAALAPRRILLVLEEFDRIQDGIDSKITSDQVPENLRHLFQHQGEVAGIFTGSRTIRRLRKDYWNMLFSLGDPVTLGGLEPGEARLLIEKPVSGRLVYAEEAIRSIIEVTACQPLLIQGICQRIFALCKQRKQATVALELVEEVINEKTTDNEHFETLWGYLHTERRRCLLFLVDELAGNDVAVSFNVLRTAIEEKGLQYSRQSLEADLKYLLESDILGVNRHDRQEFYRLEVPMFALWLRKNKDFNQTLAAATDEAL